MHEVEVLYVSNSTEMEPERHALFISGLPSGEVAHIQQFRRWQDRQARLWGRILLADTMTTHYNSLSELLEFNAWGKPSLPGFPAFNIAHSGNWVVLAVTEGPTVGVDIEARTDIPLKDFSRYMSDAQWADIHGAPDPLARFFQYWTMKESVIKAVGKGLSIPLASLHFEEGRCTVEGTTYYVHPFVLPDGCAGCVATDFLPETVTVKEWY